MFGFLNRQPQQAQPTLAQIEAGLADGSLVLLDVRDAGEVAQSGLAKGALHIPLMMLPMRADPAHPDFHPALAPEKTIAIYCAAGGRAGQAQNILSGLGYDKTHNLGGLTHWVQAGGAVVKG